VLIIIAIMIGMLFVQPVMGLLSDRFGRRPFIICGSIALLLLAIPAFMLINSNVIGLIFAGLLMLAVMWSLYRVLDMEHALQRRRAQRARRLMDEWIEREIAAQEETRDEAARAP